MKNCLKYLSVAIYLVFTIFSALPVNSTPKNKSTYHPPKGKIRQQVRKAGGSRGECNLPLNDTVTLLVPQDHTATTVLEHPTFLWNVSQKLSLPLRFTLLEPGKKPIFIEQLKPEPGIVALRLPQNSQPLKIGKTYRWTVTVICNQKKPSRNLFAQAWIERVALPKSNLTKTTFNSLFCTAEFAQLGIWYDALSCNYAQLIKNQHQSKNNFSEFWSLLEEIDLPNLSQSRPRLSFYK
jgi:hypothetical protein